MSKASIYYTVGNVDSKHDVKELKHEINILRGVLSVSVSEQSDRIAVDYDTSGVEPQRIQKKIENLGYNIKDVQSENHIM